MRKIAVWLLVAGATQSCVGYESYDEENVAETEQAMKVCAEGEELRGIDVSKWQGEINWPAVAKDDVAYAITRTNDGSYMDPKFDTNWAQIKAQGIVRSAYQYWHPGNDPVEQADVFIDKVGKLGAGDLPGVIDVETTDNGVPPATIAANIAIWMDLVEEGTGRRPMIYTGRYFWNDNVKSDAFKDDPLWIAHYTTTGCPTIPDAWSNWALWQFTDSGSVDGIGGNVDLNFFNGEAMRLHDLAGNGYRASIVEVDYPTSMPAGTSAVVRIVLKNEGKRTWDSSTKLGTTEPRDRSSDFASSSWESETRAIAMPKTVMGGEEVTLEFTLVAPMTTGNYSEHFNLLQEGGAGKTTWFSDTPPSGAPRDDAILLSIEVTEGDGNSSAGVGGSAAVGAGAGGSGGASGIPSSQSDGGCSLHSGQTTTRPWWLSMLALCMLRRRKEPKDTSPNLSHNQPC